MVGTLATELETLNLLIGEVVSVRERLAAMQTHLDSLSTLADSVTTLQQSLSSLTLAGSRKADGSQATSHGLCQDPACEVCLGQAQHIATEGYNKGRTDMAQHIESLLVLAGGEPMRERVVQVISQGQAIWEQQQASVNITN